MRHRITITISDTTLQAVENLIDHQDLRNRSQVIEHLLHQTLAPSINTAVILAGGHLYSHSPYQNQPTSLLPLGNQPLIHHTLTLLQTHGFSTVIICLDSRNLPLQTYLKAHPPKRLKLIFCLEKIPLGTGGALKSISHLLPRQPFLVLHSDILTNINLTQFISYYQDQHLAAAVATKPRPGKLSFGRVFVEGNQVIDFQEPDKLSPVSLINTGIYLFDYSCLSLLPPQKVFKLEHTLIPKLIRQRQLSGYTFQGLWYDISSQPDYQEAFSRLSTNS